MNIYWHGISCFKIEGEKSTLVTDPFTKDYGLRVPRLAADVVTISHDHKDHNNVEAVKGPSDKAPFVVTNPGEYEVNNIFIYGIPSYHDEVSGKERGGNTMYRYDIDGMRIAHLGDLGHVLESSQLEKIEGVDILMIPVGGTSTINAKQAVEIISQIEPRIVIPMHYHIPGLTTKVDGLQTFIKEFGVTPKETVSKFKISKKDLPQDDVQLVVLEP